MCSTTRGPAICPSLVTCPTSSSAAPLALAKRISACAEPRTWLTVPGADFDRVAPHGLDRIDDYELRRVAGAQRRHDVLDQRLRGELHRRLGEAETRRAKAHLRGRFFARRHRSRAPPDRATAAQAWIRRVDLPIPGLAANQRRRARAQSRRPRPGRVRRFRWRSAARAGRRRDRSSSGKDAPAAPRRAAAPPTPSAAASSMIVFHSPQDSHLPCQRWVIAPQFWQT